MKTENKNNSTRSNTVSVEKERSAYKKRIKRRKWMEISAAVVLIGLLFGAAYFYQKSNTENEIALMNKKNEVLNVQLQERDSLINEWVSTFNKIENDMARIKEKERILTNKSSDLEISDDRRGQILSDLQYINTLLEENKNKIKQLNSKLRSSGIQIASLKEKIEMLDKSIVARDSSINELKMALIDKDFHISELNKNMDELEQTLNRKEKVIEAQENELNKAYVAYGTYKELKEKGVLTKEGGFLWVGKNTTLKEDFNEEQFTEINRRETKRIEVNSKKVDFVTEHPDGSYEIVEDKENDMIAYIEIIDPYEFWKVSNYAVVETK